MCAVSRCRVVVSTRPRSRSSAGCCTETLAAGRNRPQPGVLMICATYWAHSSSVPRGAKAFAASLPAYDRANSRTVSTASSSVHCRRCEAMAAGAVDGAAAVAGASARCR